jgi:hypothetical protein
MSESRPARNHRARKWATNHLHAPAAPPSIDRGAVVGARDVLVKADGAKALPEVELDKRDATGVVDCDDRDDVAVARAEVCV